MPGRLSAFSEHPEIIIADGAHTLAGARALRRTIYRLLFEAPDLDDLRDTMRDKAIEEDRAGVLLDAPRTSSYSQPDHSAPFRPESNGRSVPRS